jgi:hypothetical protein
VCGPSSRVRNRRVLILPSSRFTPITERLFVKLSSTIQNRASSDLRSERVLDALRCIGLLTYNIVSTEVPRTLHHSNDERFPSPRRPQMGNRPTGDARSVQVGRILSDGLEAPTTSSRFWGTTSTSRPKGKTRTRRSNTQSVRSPSAPVRTCLEALAQFDPTAPPFFDGIRSLFHADKPHELKKAALCFLAHIEARWFPVFSEHVSPDAVQDFCEDLVSAINEVFTDQLEVKRPRPRFFSLWRMRRPSDSTFPFTCGSIWNSFTN